MTEKKRKKLVDEISDREKAKYAIFEYMLQKRIEALHSCSEIRPGMSEKRVKPEDIFGESVSAIQRSFFYEVERAYFREDRSLINPRIYYQPPINSQDEADELFKQAKDGDLFAKLRLGNSHYMAGNYEGALSYFEDATREGNSDALVRMGELLYSGKGTEQDFSKAIWAFEMAIIIDANCDALRALGICYVDGDGVEKDVEKGLIYLNRSASQGHSGSMIFLGDMYQYGQGVEKNLDEAKKWYERAAIGCSGIAYNKLMDVYGMEKDYECLKGWSKLYMDMGLPRAFYDMGTMFYDGEGVNEDKSRGIGLIRQAADMNDPIACYSLSKILAETDKDQGWDYFKKAFGAGFKDAVYEMGVLLWDDDRSQAIEYIRDAATKGHGPAIEFLKEYNLS